MALEGCQQLPFRFFSAELFQSRYFFRAIPLLVSLFFVTLPKILKWQQYEISYRHTEFRTNHRQWCFHIRLVIDETTRRIKPVHHLIDVLIKMRQQANKIGWRTGAEPIIRQE